MTTTIAVDRLGLTVGDVAAEADVTPSTVRFYEQHGLLRASRTAGNQRRFGHDAPCRIKIAKVAQRVGLTIKEIAELLDRLPPDPGPPDWMAIGEALVRDARQRMAQLQAALDAITSGEKLCQI
jgi:MerR family redox-sensitive transcriptional activator SoxR